MILKEIKKEYEEAFKCYDIKLQYSKIRHTHLYEAYRFLNVTFYFSQVASESIVLSMPH